MSMLLINAVQVEIHEWWSFFGFWGHFEPVPYWLDNPLYPVLVHAKLVASGASDLLTASVREPMLSRFNNNHGTRLGNIKYHWLSRSESGPGVIEDG